MSQDNSSQNFQFIAETRQLLNILVHSLYTERDIFLRELISNASDALTRLNYEMLTSREIFQPDSELAIRIKVDADKKIIIVQDSGVGMTKEEIIQNLGTIAHSGVGNFAKALQQKENQLSDLIGQFGVGFYSAFMVANFIKVSSRSFQPDSQAITWSSNGEDSYSISDSDMEERGTIIEIHLRDDALEFLQEYRLREIITKHSDFIPYPIYLGEDDKQVNRQTALWRQQPRELQESDYFDFYKQFTLDHETPLAYTHLATDAPVQMYAVLFAPPDVERNIFSARKQDGLKLYARKVLIQDYCLDLLPKFFRFIHGVVDSEDIALNVSRESIQSSRVIAQLRKLVTSRTIEMFKELSSKKPDAYIPFWEKFGSFIKEGIATEFEHFENLLPLLRFKTLSNPDHWIDLNSYAQNMKEGQKKIYYILGEDSRSISHSPHLDLFRHYEYDVLLLTDPLDPFMLMHLKKFNELELVNVTSETLEPIKPETETQTQENQLPPLNEDNLNQVINLFKEHLKEKISDVRTTSSLVKSPARLINLDNTISPEMQRVYHLLKQDFEAPKKVLEINPQHALIIQLSKLPLQNELSPLIIDQIYEDALLIEGLHPDPASMIVRIQKLMETAVQLSNDSNQNQ